MGCCSIAARLMGKTRAQLMDHGLRAIHQVGPRASFLQVRERITGHVIEIGCGTGVLFEDYHPDARVSAVELDPEFAALAREHAPSASARIDVIIADAERLGFADATFDAAVVHLTLCCVTDAARCLGEVIRVLRPGGMFYLYEHVVSTSPAYRWVQNVTAPLWRQLSEGCSWNRDTGALVRALPLEIESEERGLLRRSLMPPLPTLAILARKKGAASTA